MPLSLFRSPLQTLDFISMYSRQKELSASLHANEGESVQLMNERERAGRELEKERERDRKTDRDRQTDRQKDRQKQRETGRQTDRQKQRERPRD